MYHKNTTYDKTGESVPRYDFTTEGRTKESGKSCPAFYFMHNLEKLIYKIQAHFCFDWPSPSLNYLLLLYN